MSTNNAVPISSRHSSWMALMIFAKSSIFDRFRCHLESHRAAPFTAPIDGVADSNAEHDEQTLNYSARIGPRLSPTAQSLQRAQGALLAGAVWDWF